MDPHTESTQLSLHSFLASQSQRSFNNSSLTMTANLFPASVASLLATTNGNHYQSQQKITHIPIPQISNTVTMNSSSPPIPSHRCRPQERGIQDPSPISQATSNVRPSAYRPHLTPMPTLHPHCLGQDHLCLWKPATPQVLNDSAGHSVNLSEEDMTHIFNVMSHTWGQSTQEGYSSGLLSWHVYCNKKSIPASRCWMILSCSTSVHKCHWPLSLWSSSV